MSHQTKFMLGEDRIPTHWVNLLPDLPGEPLPPLSPATTEPAGPDDLAPLFPMALIEQEVSAEPEIEIPDAGARRLPAVAPDAAVPRAPARAGARHARRTSTTSTRASRPAGSHKPNTAVPQAYYNAQAGIAQARRPRPAPASGARRWRSPARCSASSARSSWSASQLRPEALPALDDARPGARPCTARRPTSPRPAARRPRTRRARSGSRSPRRSRSPRSDEDTNYSLGSVLNHVLPAPDGDRPGGDRPAASSPGEYPDVVVGCVGGGSNFAGLAFPFMRATLRDERETRFVAAEPAACPTLTRGVYALRLRRHRRADAADADVHARPRLRAAARPRRRPALPRRRADALRRWSRRAWSRRAPTARTRPSRPRCSSPAPRGSSRRPSPRTRSAAVDRGGRGGQARRARSG